MPFGKNVWNGVFAQNDQMLHLQQYFKTTENVFFNFLFHKILSIERVKDIWIAVFVVLVIVGMCEIDKAVIKLRFDQKKSEEVR